MKLMMKTASSSGETQDNSYQEKPKVPTSLKASKENPNNTISGTSLQINILKIIQFNSSAQFLQLVQIFEQTKLRHCEQMDT